MQEALITVLQSSVKVCLILNILNISVWQPSIYLGISNNVDKLEHYTFLLYYRTQSTIYIYDNQIYIDSPTQQQCPLYR